MYNEEKIISTLSTIQEICFTDLNSVERILTLSNLLLIEAETYLPSELQKILNNYYLMVDELNMSY